MKQGLKTERDQDVYIRTGKTAVLAIFKLVEALAGCFAVWYLLAHMDKVPNVLMNLLEIQTDSESRYVTIYQSVFNGIQIGLIVRAALLIPDGLAVFFTRFARKGAGAAAFFQLFFFVTNILTFLFGIAGMILYCNFVIEAAQSIRRITIGELIEIFGTDRVVVFLTVYILVFLIIVIYHYRAWKTLLHVRKEIIANSILKLRRKNRLGSASVAGAIVLAINTILSVIILVTDELQLSNTAGFLKPVISAYELFGIVGVAVSIILTVKFCFVSWCNTDFNKPHHSLN